MQPKVTIVTITYNLLEANREKTFRQCVESVHNQTYENIEHIVIDGASNDGTIELLKEYADKNWLTYYSEPDTGIYNAMNKGLAKATGEYITFLNSDDFYHNLEGISETVKTFINSNVDFVYSSCRYLGEDDILFTRMKPMPEAFYIRMPFSHQSLFVKTDLMKKLNGFDEENFKNAGDFEFIVRLFLSKATNCEVPCEFVTYRLGGLSDNAKNENISEVYKVFEKNYSEFVSGETINWEEMYSKFIVHKNVFQGITNNVDKNLAEKMKQHWEKQPCVDNNYKKLKTFPNPVIICEEKKYKLFNFIPLLSIKPIRNKLYINLFAFLPVCKLKWKSAKDIRIYLFSLIPVWKINKKNGEQK